MSSTPDPFWLGAIHVIPDERVIVRDGHRTKVEPKVIDVLLFLAERPGEVVTRDNIIQAVWPRIEVSDDVLSRSIYQLRKHLGDSTSEPRYISTVPKTGYRFLVKKSFTDPQEKTTNDSRASDREFESSGSAKRYVGLAVAASVLLIVASLTSVFEKPTGDGGEVATVPARIQVGFFPVFAMESDTRQAELDLIALSLNDMIAARTAEFQTEDVRFTVLTNGDALDDDRRAEAFDAEHLEYAFYGWLEDSTGAARALLTVEVLTRNSLGEIVATPANIHEIPYFNGATDIARLGQYRDAITGRLIGYVTQEVPLVHSLSMPQREGFRLLLFGERDLYLGNDCGLSAAKMLTRSLDLLPELARTYNMLGLAYWTQAWECGRNAELVDKAVAALEYSIALDPEYIQSVHMYTTVLAETGRLGEAYAYLAEYLAKYPDHHYLLFSEIIILQYAGLLDESTRLVDRVLAEDPLALVTEMVDMPYALFYAQDYERFLELSPATKMPSMTYHRAYALWRLGRVDEALQLLEETHQMDNGGVYVDYAMALHDIITEDFAGARSKLYSAIDRRQTASPTITDLAFRDGQLLNLSGDPEGALKHLRSAAELGFICLPCFAEHDSLLDLQGHAEFKAILELVQQKQMAFTTEFAHLIYR